MTFGELVNAIRFSVNESDVAKVNSTIKSISSTAKKLLGMIGIGISLTQLNALAEEYSAISDRIAYAVGESGNLEEAQQGILDAANECRMAYGSFANQVTALKQANQGVFPINEAITFTENVNKLGKAAGYSDSEISTMNTTIKTIVSNGKASVADISRMLKTTPALAETLAKAFDTDAQGLQKMAKEGKLTAEALRDAMRSSTESINSAYSKLNFGVSDALTQIKNKFMVWVGETDQMFEITQSIAKLMTQTFDLALKGLTKARDSVKWLSDKLGGTRNLLRLIAILGGSIFGVMKFSKIKDALTGILGIIKSIHLRTVLLIAILVALFLIVDDIVAFMQGRGSVIGDAFEAAGIDAQAMRDKIVNIWNNLKAFFVGVWNSIKAFFAPIAAWFRGILEKVFGEDIFAGLGEGIAGVIEFLDRLTSKLAENSDLQDKIGKAIPIILAVAAGLKIIVGLVGAASGVKKVADGISAIGGGAGGVVGKLQGLGAAVLMVAAAFGILAFAAIKLAQAGPDAIGIFTAMMIAVVGLVAILASLGPGLAGATGGLLALGGALLMAAAAVAILTFCALQLAAAGPEATTAMIVLMVGLAALIAITALLGPTIAEGAAGLLLFGAALLVVAAAALLGGVALLIITSALPALVTYGFAGAEALTLLGAAMTVFAGGATLASAGAVAAGLGFGALALAAGAAALVFAPLADSMGIVGNAVAILDASANNAATGLWSIRESSKGIAADMNVLIASFTTVSSAIAPFSIAVSTAAGATTLFSTALSLGAGSSALLLTSLIGIVAQIVAWPAVVRIFTSGMGQMASSTSSNTGRMTSAFKSATDTISSTISSTVGRARTWGADLIDQLISGMRSKSGSLQTAVNEVAETINGPLHFSVPDEGPLKDFDSYMPDMIQLLVRGMGQGKEAVKGGAQMLAMALSSGIADGLQSLGSLAAPQIRTISTVTNGSSISKSVIQNNSFSNTFNGERAAQRSASGAMRKASDDVTSLLARGLAYAR